MEVDNHINQLCRHLIGHTVSVRLRSGKIYTGILHSHSVSRQGLSLDLRMAREKDHVLSKPQATKKIEANDIIEVSVVRSDDPQVTGFKTDVEISGGELKERSLQKWNDTDSADEDLVEGCLEDDNFADWDQFAVNEKLTGIKSTYEDQYELLYTSKLDKSSQFYRERIDAARKKAASIEKQPVWNPHRKEERGLDDGNNSDEEERYSSVIREDSTKEEGSGTRYVIPNRRAGDSKKEQLKSSQDSLSASGDSIKGIENKKKDEEPLRDAIPEKVKITASDPAISQSPPDPSTLPLPSATISKPSSVPALSSPAPAKVTLNANAKEFTPGGFKIAAAPYVPQPMMPHHDPHYVSYPYPISQPYIPQGQKMPYQAYYAPPKQHSPTMAPFSQSHAQVIPNHVPATQPRTQNSPDPESSSPSQPRLSANSNPYYPIGLSGYAGAPHFSPPAYPSHSLPYNVPYQPNPYSS